MRKGMKKAISALLALMTTAALTLTTYAIDYAHAPVVDPSIGTGVAAGGAVSTTTETVVEATGSSSSTGTIEVKSLASVTVRSSAVKSLAKKGGVLKIESPSATVSIDSSTVKKARKVDLSMEVYGSSSRSVIDMRSKADFGCEVKITVKNCKMSKAKLAKAHVYCDGEDLGPVELDDDGYPVITVTKGGKYIIK